MPRWPKPPARTPESTLKAYLAKVENTNAYKKLVDDVSKEAFLRVSELQWRARRLASGERAPRLVTFEKEETTQRPRPWDMSNEDFLEHASQRQITKIVNSRFKLSQHWSTAPQIWGLAPPREPQYPRGIKVWSHEGTTNRMRITTVVSKHCWQTWRSTGTC